MYLEHFQDIQLAMNLARLVIISPKIIYLPIMENLTTVEFENIKILIWLKKV